MELEYFSGLVLATISALFTLFLSEPSVCLAYLYGTTSKGWKNLLTFAVFDGHGICFTCCSYVSIELFENLLISFETARFLLYRGD